MEIPTTIKGNHSKRYIDATKMIEPQTARAPQDAVDLLKQVPSVRFDETVELHLRTASDPRHADQSIRGVVNLPHGTGKQIRVLAFASGEASSIAQEAGADFVGDDDLIKKIEEGWVEFDVAVATPDIMNKIGRLGRVLGRRGLMPNPRTGTVVSIEDLPRVIQEAKAGRVEYRMDRTALLHIPIGKASFSSKQLLENLAATVDAVQRSRPTTIKGQFIRTAYICTTMGPSIKLDLSMTLGLTME